MIKKIGNKYVVYSKDGGKRLGTHDSRKKAEKQLAAIEISKHMRKEIRKMVRNILSESDVSALPAAVIDKMKSIKSQAQGEQPNTAQVTGYDKEYVVIGRTFDKPDDGVKFVFDLNNPKESNAYKALPKTHPLKSYIDSSLDVWKSNNEDGNINLLNNGINNETHKIIKAK